MRVLVVLMGLLVVLAACSGGGEASSTSTTVPPISTTVAAGSTTTGPVVTTEGSTTTVAPGQVVLVVFAAADQSDCVNVTSVERIVEAGVDPIGAAFESLVAGPTSEEEEAAGVGSMFSGETAGMVRSAALVDGLLTVDFDDFSAVIPNASTSCGSMSLVAQLNGTAFQFPEVESVTYAFEGSCEAFFNWLQRDCQVYGAGRS